MSSVDQDRAGTASGINNAVARVAGVLAIALLGIVMVKAFSFRLDSALHHLALPESARQELRANASRLAGIQIPAGLEPSIKAAIQKSIGASFTFGFRILMLFCAALSLASSGIVWLMLPKQQQSS